MLIKIRKLASSFIVWLKSVYFDAFDQMNGSKARRHRNVHNQQYDSGSSFSGIIANGPRSIIRSTGIHTHCISIQHKHWNKSENNTEVQWDIQMIEQTRQTYE